MAHPVISKSMSRWSYGRSQPSLMHMPQVPANQVELYGLTTATGIQGLTDDLEGNKLFPKISDRNAPGGLVIAMGRAHSSDRTDRKDIQRKLLKLNRRARRNKRSIILVPSRDDVLLDGLFTHEGVYGTQGYLDSGISFAKDSNSLGNIAMADDVMCLWAEGNRNGTVIIPDRPTLGGMLKAEMVMRKADILVTYNPPYEVVSENRDAYPSTIVADSKLVSVARQIWKPVVHFYGNNETVGKLVYDGDSYMLGLRHRPKDYLIKWSLGDLERRIDLGPAGFPLNTELYQTEGVLPWHLSSQFGPSEREMSSST